MKLVKYILTAGTIQIILLKLLFLRNGDFTIASKTYM